MRSFAVNLFVIRPVMLYGAELLLLRKMIYKED